MWRRAKLVSSASGIGNQADDPVSVTDQLRTQLSSIQSSHHNSTSELAVLRTRIDVSPGQNMHKALKLTRTGCREGEAGAV